MSAVSHAVASECCEWSAGRCLTQAGGVCLALDGKRCRHFEEAVLPLADVKTRRGGLERQRRMEDARAAYWKTCKPKKGPQDAREGP